MKFTYSAEVVPGILRVNSNRRKIAGYALCSTPLATSKPDGPNIPALLEVNYLLNPDLNRGLRAPGKVYSKKSDLETSIQIPLGGLGSLSCLYRHDERSPTIEVDRLYHILGRITVGNIHSFGWLMRDLSNITLLLNGYALLHAAALKLGKRTILIVGLSNTGKTTTVFDLTLNGPCQTFGDDLVVTDGSRLYACPLTSTNVSPSLLPTVKKKIAHWSARKIPFYEYFGPTVSHSVADYVGAENIAEPCETTDILFLKRSEVRKTSGLNADEAEDLLISSNRTEFTFMNSALFSSFDYLTDRSIVETAVNRENDLLKQVCQRRDCQLIEGDMPYFRQVIGDILDIPSTPSE